LPNNDQREKLNQLNQSQSPKEYEVKLTSGETFYLLSHNSMDAAYSALELSMNRSCKLLNVRIVDEW